MNKENENKTERRYTYEGIECYEQELRPGHTLKEALAAMASPELDMDIFVHSHEGEDNLRTTQLLASFRFDPHSETHEAYWKQHHMHVEAMDWEDTDRQWLLMTPEGMTETETYPVLFVWHGYNNPVIMAEIYGFAELASERKWIVVLPWAKNNKIWLEEADRIMEILKNSLPIDETRIYTTGFSFGGRVSALLAQQRSDVFTAAAPCGVNASAHFYSGIHRNERDLGELKELEEMNASDPAWFASGEIEAGKPVIPVQFTGGRYDVFGAMPYNSEEKVEAVNAWAKLYGIDAKQKYLNRDLIGTEEIGLQFYELEERYIHGELLRIGTFSAERPARFRIVEAVLGLHVVNRSFCQIAVEFLEQFAKDPVTGETIVIA